MCANWEFPVFGWAMDAFPYRKCLYWFFAFFWDFNSLISCFSSGTSCRRPTPNLNHYSQVCIWVQKSQPLYFKCFRNTPDHKISAFRHIRYYQKHSLSFIIIIFSKCSFLGHLAQGSAIIQRRPITKSLSHASWYIILCVLSLLSFGAFSDTLYRRITCTVISCKLIQPDLLIKEKEFPHECNNVVMIPLIDFVK